MTLPRSARQPFLAAALLVVAASHAAASNIVLNGSLTVLLRADPSGATPGRAYTITVQCTDKSNHSSTETVFVPVSY